MVQHETFSQYYVRNRGRIVGPLSLEKIQQLAKRGQVGRLHEISADGQNWLPAATRLEIFEPPVTSSEAKTNSAADNAASPSAMTEWFYLQDSSKQGPLAHEMLEGMFRDGRLDANTMIWTNGMSDWKLAGEVPAFAHLVSFQDTSLGVSTTRSASSRTTRKTQANRGGKHGESGIVYDQAVFYTLVNSRPWVLFIAIILDLTFAVSAMLVYLTLVGGLASEVLAGPALSAALVASPALLVVLSTAILLHMYHIALVRFHVVRSAQALQQAFRRLFVMWVFTSVILLLFMLYLTVSIMALMLAS